MKKYKDLYFERYAWKERLFPKHKPARDLEMVVVLPCFKEENVGKAVRSIINCNKPHCGVSLIVLINEPETASREISTLNQRSFDEILSLALKSSDVEILPSYIKLPQKKAGVGLARKIGMDEAAWWFYTLERNGIIICFDADSTCNSDYLVNIYKAFHHHAINGGVVTYEHPLDNLGIVEYETYLRYYTGGLRFAGFPFAFQTLGSCITVRSDIYMKQGGMNTRKAGEDFYFLHKVIPLGKFRDIQEAVVYPSDRISDRVPFGTGSALAKFDPSQKYQVYHPRIFHELKAFFDAALSDDKLPGSLKNYFEGINDEYKKVKMNSTPENFRSQFFQWFDGFKVLKMVHYLRDEIYGTMDIDYATGRLNEDLWSMKDLSPDPVKRLKQIRKWDRLNPMIIK